MSMYIPEGLAEVEFNSGTGHRTVPEGFLSHDELAAFSLLIEHRRSLPIFMGDCWRCYKCSVESADFSSMAEHIIRTHDPEPMNAADREELAQGRVYREN